MYIPLRACPKYYRKQGCASYTYSTQIKNWHTMDPCITLWSKPDITYTFLSPIAPIKQNKTKKLLRA